MPYGAAGSALVCWHAARRCLHLSHALARPYFFWLGVSGRTAQLSGMTNTLLSHTSPPHSTSTFTWSRSPAAAATVTPDPSLAPAVATLAPAYPARLAWPAFPSHCVSWHGRGRLVATPCGSTRCCVPQRHVCLLHVRSLVSRVLLMSPLRCGGSPEISQLASKACREHLR